MASQLSVIGIRLSSVLYSANELTSRSALQILHDSYTSSNPTVSDRDYHAHKAAVIEISGKIIGASRKLLEWLALSIDGVSPLVLPWVYRSTATYMRVNRETRSADSSEALDILTKTLRAINRRWRSAGKYAFLRAPF